MELSRSRGRPREAAEGGPSEAAPGRNRDIKSILHVVTIPMVFLRLPLSSLDNFTKPLRSSAW